MADTRLSILKVGSTFPALRTRRGDFEDWIAAGAGLAATQVRVIDVSAGEPLPVDPAAAGVIVTGSHAMVTERNDWSERAAEWLRNAADRGVPVLGICYGHQLLAHAFGGEVGDNPRGSEFGTAQIVLETAAQRDELLGGLPATFAAHEGHTQAVLSLPPGAVRLASDDWDPHQAFRIGSRAWGVQFHPEFDPDIMHAYIRWDRQMLAAEGQDPDALSKTVRDSPRSAEVLRRFAALCRRAS